MTTPGVRDIDIVVNDGNRDDVGRIWMHRPFNCTPSAAASSTSTDSDDTHIVVSYCPLPKSSQQQASDDTLHRRFASSSNAEGFLADVHTSRAEFYASEFRSRVAEGDMKRIRRRTIHSRHGSGGVNVTIYRPPGNDGADSILGLDGICLHVHGGGWLWGDSYHQVAHRCLEMAQATNVAVVSVEYGLLCRLDGGNVDESCGASKPFDPVEDVLLAMDWIETCGPEELNARHSFVGSGESSGAHLLMLAMLRRRDVEGIALRTSMSRPSMKTCPAAPSAATSWSRWKCLNLVYGVYDLSGSPSIRADGDASVPLCGNDLLWLYELYCSRAPRSKNDDGTRRLEMDPSFSPLYANLSHFPPALLTVGTADPLRDDTVFMANVYSSYGNHVELAIYEGGEHGIGHFGLQEDEEMGVRARRHTLSFMREWLLSLE
jgi:acetyl esterase